MRSAAVTRSAAAIAATLELVRGSVGCETPSTWANDPLADAVGLDSPTASSAASSTWVTRTPEDE